MHVKREDVHICISSLLNCKMHLQLHVSVEKYLHCAIVEFEVHFYICNAPVGDSLRCLFCMIKIISGTIHSDMTHYTLKLKG
jgi:hypothetical protein